MSGKLIVVGHSKVFDTGVLYAREMGLQSSQRENDVLWTVAWPASGSVHDFLDAFRAHLLIYLRKLAIWLHAIDPTLLTSNHGWTHATRSTSSITPTNYTPGTILAPGEATDLIKCGCTSPNRACKSGNVHVCPVDWLARSSACVRC